MNVLDHGLLYGDGIFEGIRAYNGRVFKLDRHLDRLFDSAQGAADRHAGRRQPSVEQIVLDTCRRNDIVDGYIRVVVTRGVGDLGIDPRSCRHAAVIVIARPTIALYREPRAASRMVTSSFRRPSPDTLSPSIKSLNYVNNVLARMEANDRGADEALLLDVNGYVAEATADNVFIVTRPRPGDAADRHEPERHHPRDRARDRARARHPLRGAAVQSVRGLDGARSVRLRHRRRSRAGAVGGRPHDRIGGTSDRSRGEIVDAYARLVRSTGTPIAPATADCAATVPSAVPVREGGNNSSAGRGLRDCILIMTEPAYPAAARVAARVQAHFAHHLA